MSTALTASDLAAIVYVDAAHGAAADALAADFAQRLLSQGWRVAGLMQQHLAAVGGGKPALQLVDVRTGQAYPISQNLGTFSRACCLDTGGIAQASAVLRQALADRVNLAITNRFGELEATGGGFATEMAALAGEGIPVLTVVAEKHLDAWRRFTGGMGQELPVNLSALRDWFALAAGRGVPAA